MRPFNRSDLGRLWLSPAGARNYNYLGDCSLDSLSSTGAVTYNGKSYGLPQSGKNWAGSITARAGEALLGAGRDFSEIDLLVTYGDENCGASIGSDPYTAAVLIEGAVLSGEQYAAMTTLTSANRNPVAAICQLQARRVHRLKTGDTMRRHGQVTGSVVALHKSGRRLYALSCQPSGGGTVILMRLNWCDDGYSWQSAPVGFTTLNEPTSYGLGYDQFALHAWGDQLYICTGNDLLRIQAPLPGAAPGSLYAAAVRVVGASTAGVVGLAAYGGFLYALLAAGGAIRISPSQVASSTTMPGSSFRLLRTGIDSLIVGRAGGGIYARPGQHRHAFTWAANNLGWLGGSADSKLLMTTSSETWSAGASGVFEKRADFAGALIAAAEAGGVIYAIVSSGTKGSRLWASAGDPSRWVQLDNGVRDPICLLPLGDGVVVGGQDLATAANRSGGIDSITRCRSTGYIWQAASSELLIAARASEG